MMPELLAFLDKNRGLLGGASPEEQAFYLAGPVAVLDKDGPPPCHQLKTYRTSDVMDGI